MNKTLHTIQLLAISGLVVYAASLSYQVTSLSAELDRQTDKLIALDADYQVTKARLHVADFVVGSAALMSDKKTHDAVQLVLTDLSLCDTVDCAYTIYDRISVTPANK